jgi:hypothetical protein
MVDRSRAVLLNGSVALDEHGRLSVVVLDSIEVCGFVVSIAQARKVLLGE